MHNPYSPIWDEEEQIWFSECECGDLFEAETFEGAEELIDQHSQEVEDITLPPLTPTIISSFTPITLGGAATTNISYTFTSSNTATP